MAISTVKSPATRGYGVGDLGVDGGGHIEVECACVSGVCTKVSGGLEAESGDMLCNRH